MMNFQDIYRALRVAAIGLALLFAICGVMKAHAFSFDVELPSGNSLQLEREVEQQERKDAYDRTQNGEGSDRDLEKAKEYVDKDMV